MTAIGTKRVMKAYAVKRGIKIPSDFHVLWPGWGAAARQLAWAVTTYAAKHGYDIKPSMWNTKALQNLVSPPAPQIITHSWKWACPLARRSGAPPGIVWHHAAAVHLSAEQCHQEHLNNGWCGIGYHYYVEKNGQVHEGRPTWAIGAHCLSHNDWLGVCAEGNYETEKAMPRAQLESLRRVHAMLHKQWPKMVDRGHRDLNPTACPGQYYPYKQVIS